jgi:predicted TIM-barrel fold metal-dependent hydrolase
VSYDGPIIDVDVHHSYSRPSDLVAYLPKQYRELVTGSSITPNPHYGHLTPTWGSNIRLDAYPDNGLPGSDFSLMERQLLEPMHIERVILTYNTGQEVGHENVGMAVAAASALNDWCVERWLSGLDDRLFGMIIVSTFDPQAAASEIRRQAGNERMVGILFVDAGLGPPFGHPIYHPVFEAAAECGLPVAIHFGYAYTSGHLGRPTAGGNAANFFEYYVINWQAGAHHVASFITHGVFEKWPSLKLVMLEDGFVWAPWLFNHLDSQYKRLKLESPWVERLPSEYLRDNIRFSTQPFEYDPGLRSEQYISLLEVCPFINEILMFASDYPHWDTDTEDHVSRLLPREWHESVFYQNAANTYRWPKHLTRMPRLKPAAAGVAAGSGLRQAMDRG